jgi:hypothetical protein
METSKSRDDEDPLEFLVVGVYQCSLTSSSWLNVFIHEDHSWLFATIHTFSNRYFAVSRGNHPESWLVFAVKQGTSSLIQRVLAKRDAILKFKLSFSWIIEVDYYNTTWYHTMAILICCYFIFKYCSLHSLVSWIVRVRWVCKQWSNGWHHIITIIGGPTYEKCWQ